MNKTMKAAYLPGNSSVVIKEVEIPDRGTARCSSKQNPPRFAAAISGPFTASTSVKGRKDTRIKLPGMNLPAKSSNAAPA